MKSDAVDQELDNLKSNQYDPAVHHQYYDKHNIKFAHGGGDQNLDVPQTEVKKKTKSERFASSSNVQETRLPRKTERFYTPSKEMETN